MAEGLKLQLLGHSGPDFGNLGKTQLSCQHNPLGAQVIPALGAGVVGDGLLGGNMPLAVGRIFSGQGEGTQIRDNQGVHAGVVQTFQVFRKPGNLIVSRHGVHGDMALDAVVMGKLHRQGQLLGGEIPREGAHPKAGAREIYRVRAVGSGHFQPLHIPGGTEQFQFSHSPSDCRAVAASAANWLRYFSCSSWVVENWCIPVDGLST